MNDFGEKLREWGIAEYGNLAKLAEAMDILPSSLTRYLKGDRLPGYPMLEKLNSLGMDMRWLFRDEKGVFTVNEKSEPYRTEEQRLREENKQLKKQLEQIISILQNKKAD